MVCHIYDALRVDSMSGNFTACISDKKHNLNEMNVLHIGMALA